MTATRADHQALSVFCSYSHRDEKQRQRLGTHISLLRHEGLIDVWHDRTIRPGEEWEKTIHANLEAAHIILLLVSPDFIASRYAYGVEMKRAMERHEAKEARVIPIILSPVDWQSAPFGKLLALPTDGKPVALWQPRDSAWFVVTSGLRKVVEELTAELQTPRAKVGSPDRSPSARAKASTRPDRHTRRQNDDIDTLNTEAWELNSQGRYEEALVIFERAVRLQPGDPVAWYNKSFALSGLGRYGEALQALDVALALQPDDPQILSAKAYVQGDLGQHQEALAAYEQVLRLTPDDHGAWYNKGVQLAILGRHEDAIAAYDQAIHLQSDNPQAWHNKGWELSVLRRFEEAIEAYDEALRLRPDDVETWYNKGWAEGKMDE